MHDLFKSSTCIKFNRLNRWMSLYILATCCKCDIPLFRSEGEGFLGSSLNPLASRPLLHSFFSAAVEALLSILADSKEERKKWLDEPDVVYARIIGQLLSHPQ